MNTKNLAQSIGAAFRAARTARGLTTAQAAELLRLQPDFYGRIEGGNSFPTILTCARAVEVLGVNPGALFGCAYAVDADPRFLAASAEHDRRRAESLAAECEALQRELGRVRADRDAAGAQAYEFSRALADARDRFDAMEAERETLRMLAELRGEDPDVPAHPDQLRLSLGTGLTPAGLIIAAGVKP